MEKQCIRSWTHSDYEMFKGKTEKNLYKPMESFSSHWNKLCHRILVYEYAQQQQKA